MSELISVVGYGPVGAAVTARITAAGRAVRVVQRSKPAHLPDGASFEAADVLQREETLHALQGASAVICALGFPYVSAIWEKCWPRAMNSMLAACTENRARLIFADNLYMYGPQDGPLVETLPLTHYGRKPSVRAEVTRLWQAAHAAGQVQAVAVRAPDFYGPGVAQSIVGDRVFGAIARAGPALLLEKPDHPHDLVHVDDFSRAIVTLLDAPSADYGQAWHVPCDRTRTLREVLAIGARALNQPLSVRTLSQPLAFAMGAFSPELRAANEMRFLFDRPYRVDWNKFGRRFWSDPTPLDQGIAEAAHSFRLN